MNTQTKFSTIILRLLAVVVCYIALFTNDVNGVCPSVPFCTTCATVGACDVCNSGYGVDTTTKKCVDCDTTMPGCTACTTTNPKACTECAQANFTVGTDGTCQACAPDCRTCTTAGAAKCDSCNSGFRLVAATKTCEACKTTNCALCPNDAAVCTSCKSGFFGTTTCTACNGNCTFCAASPPTCNPGFCVNTFGFNTVSKQCEPCGSNCRKCEVNQPPNCDVGQCTSRYTVNSATKKCEACTPNCASCETAGPGKCDTGRCDPGYMLQANGTCLIPPCTAIPDCLICTVNTTCTRCKDLFGTPSATNRSSCLPCSNKPNCFNCTNLGRCLQCTTTAYGPVLNGTVGGCELCTPNCRSCATAGAGKCDTCDFGWTLTGNKTCLRCTDLNCQTCDNVTLVCSVCKTGYTLDSATSKCVACAPNCEFCNGNPGKCNSGFCVNGTTFNTATQLCDGMCIALPNCLSCPSGAAGICEQCMNADFFGLRADKRGCQDCALQTGCDRCQIVTQCTKCKSIFDKPSTTGDGTCAANTTSSLTTAGVVTGPVVTQGGVVTTGGIVVTVGTPAVVTVGTPAVVTVGTPAATPAGITTPASVSPGTCVVPTTPAGACIANCRSCSTAGQCDFCNAGYAVNAQKTCTACSTCKCQTCPNGPCVICNSGYYLNNATTPSTCSPCADNCVFCNLNPGKCDPGFCLDGFTFNSATMSCDRNASATTPSTTTGICQTLPFCASCTNPKICDRCIEQPFYGFRPAKDGCEECLTSKGCFACYNITLCTNCSSSMEYPMQDGSGDCAPCASNCVSCASSGGLRCDSCATGFTLNTNTRLCESGGTAPTVSASTVTPGLSSVPSGLSSVSVSSGPSSLTPTQSITPTLANPSTLTPGLSTITSITPIVSSATVSVPATVTIPITSSSTGGGGTGTSSGGLSDTEKIIVAVASSVGGVIASLLLGYCAYQLCCRPPVLPVAPAGVQFPQSTGRLMYFPQSMPVASSPSPSVYVLPAPPPRPRVMPPKRWVLARRGSYLPPGYGYSGMFQ